MTTRWCTGSRYQMGVLYLKAIFGRMARRPLVSLPVLHSTSRDKLSDRVIVLAVTMSASDHPPQTEPPIRPQIIPHKPRPPIMVESLETDNLFSGSPLLFLQQSRLLEQKMDFGQFPRMRVVVSF